MSSGRSFSERVLSVSLIGQGTGQNESVASQDIFVVSRRLCRLAGKFLTDGSDGVSKTNMRAGRLCTLAGKGNNLSAYVSSNGKEPGRVFPCFKR